MSSFASRIIRWQAKHGRRDLPWQGARDAYRLWISEVMLQQTQVSTVIPYYERFLARFPTVAALARAEEDEVLALWSGLGYYARARNLLRAARLVASRGREFPRTFDALAALPGVGRSTAGAIAAFASGERRAILDGNVRRVLARHAGIAGDPSSPAVGAELWRVAEARLPLRGLEGYTQGLMDLGAGVCTSRNPRCDACPVAKDCVARIEDRSAELPGRRRRARRARRSTCMLIVLDRGEVLLEKRPSTGIWGGLWSLPEAPDEASVALVAKRDWGITPTRLERLEPFEHAFTHFTLEVFPWRVHGRRRRGAAERGLWLPIAELRGAALPSPVRRFLRQSASVAGGSGEARRVEASRRSARGASASRRS